MCRVAAQLETWPLLARLSPMIRRPASIYPARPVVFARHISDYHTRRRHIWPLVRLSCNEYTLRRTGKQALLAVVYGDRAILHSS
jgi:hypothetical protein